MSRAYIVPLSILVFVTTVTLASFAKAVCDVNACVSYCQKSSPQAALGNYCS